MKKLTNFLLLFLSLFVLSASFVQAEEIDDLFAGARWVEDEIIEENNLPYGVNHIKVHGQTSTSMTGYDVDGFEGLEGLVEPGKLYDQQVNVIEVPSSENVRVTTWAYLNGHKWTLNTVRALIHDYESKHPGWKVIGAINGDFFDISGSGALPYQTSGALVSGGEFYKTTTGNLVGFRNDGSTDSLVGNKPVERTPNMILSIYDNDGEIIKEFNIDKINANPSENETSVFYSYYNNKKIGEDANGKAIYEKEFIATEVTDEGYYVNSAELALPNNANDFYGKGKISTFEPKTLGVGEFAILTNNNEVNEFLDKDVVIRVQYKYIGAYEGINDISGGGTTIMENGVDSGQGIADRAPRTVIGRKADGTIVMMVIDGRQSAYGMYGADRTELGAIMNYYGAVEAYNLDGGGSSTMIIRKDGELVVLNSPSDGRERTDANAILVVVKDPEINIEATATIDSLNLDVDLVAMNDHDVDELYVTLNGETKLVTDGQVEFTNLSSNTDYPYHIEYKDSAGELVRIVTSGKFKTYKTSPIFNGITIIEKGDSFEFLLDYDDPDLAASYDKAALKLDGTAAGYFFQAKKTIPRSFMYSFNTITITTTISIGDGKNKSVSIEITEFDIILTIDGQIQRILDIHNEYALKVYG